MEALEFYDWNAHIDYPLDRRAVASNGTVLPTSVLLDMGIVFGGESGVHEATQTAHLWQLTSETGGYGLWFVAASDNGPITLKAFCPSDAILGSILDLESDPPDPNVAYGFVVVGDVPAIPATLRTDPTVSFTDKYNPSDYAYVEPSRCQSLCGSVVSRVDCYAKQSTQWAASGETAAPAVYLPVAQDLTGELLFTNGYNQQVGMDVPDNAVTFSAGVGQGEGEICNQSSISGQPTCGDLITCINGLAANQSGAITIGGDNGVEVVPYNTDIDPNGLIIQVGNVGDLFCSDAGEGPNLG